MNLSQQFRDLKEYRYVVYADNGQDGDTGWSVEVI